jgi:hypothetical protein
MELTPDARTLVRVYLNDHRAAASGGVSLARRIQHNNASSALGDTMRRVIPDIEQDATTLEHIIDRLGVPSNRPKQFLAAAAERVSRLKLNARLTAYSPLSRLLEVEALLAGIDAKRSLWCALGSSAAAGVLPEFDFTALAQRATEQRRQLQPHHRAAASTAFGAATEGAMLEVDEHMAPHV